MFSIIGITGVKGQGKTFFAQILNHLLILNNYHVKILNFADYLKQVASECFGREIGQVHEKLSKYERKLLCDIGDKLREIDEECLLKVIERQIQNFNGFVIVGDVRLTREADMIHKYNGLVVRVSSNVYNRDEKYMREHKTETEITEIIEDHIVYNNGSISDLTLEGKKVLSKFIDRNWIG